MLLLHIETSTNVCSVALSENENCIFSIANYDGMNHAALLSIYIQQALDLLKTEQKMLDAVVVSSGPGSYTGLRIGVSTAKGLCYGLDIPLIAISTLEIMLRNAIRLIKPDSSAMFCPMIDARRMEVYAAMYSINGEIVREIGADIIDADSYKSYLSNQNVYFFGNGAEKCKTTLTHENAIFIDDVFPLAEYMIPLAVKSYNEGNFVDVAYFEPFYLKEFQTTTPKSSK